MRPAGQVYHWASIISQASLRMRAPMCTQHGTGVLPPFVNDVCRIGRFQSVQWGILITFQSQQTDYRTGNIIAEPCSSASALRTPICQRHGDDQQDLRRRLLRKSKKFHHF